MIRFCFIYKIALISGDSLTRRRDIKRRRGFLVHTRRWHLRQPQRWHLYADARSPSSPPGRKERARLHFSFTFASAERKITGSHYARHVGSFMSLSPGPSTFAISPPTFSATSPPAPAFVFYPLPTLSIFAPLRSSASGARRRYYLFRKLTPGQGERDWKILRSFTPSFSAFINRHHSLG